jgi:hypothetical protein
MVRSLATKARRLVLLSPEQSRVPSSFVDVETDLSRHQALLAEMQRLRGRLYLQDGAIEPWELSPDKRHQTPADQESWHLLALTAEGEVCGCARYREHAPADPVSKLGVAASPLARSKQWSLSLFSAVNSEIYLARSRNLSFVEVGGWALTDEFRRTPEAVKIALSAYSLARALGGCIGITTATVRHSSASILRRIGGERIQCGGVEIPTYYDPRYGCQMVILRFDSAAPNPRYSPWVEELEAQLPFVSVVCAASKERLSHIRRNSFEEAQKFRTWPAPRIYLEPTIMYHAKSGHVETHINKNQSRSDDAPKSNQCGD